jgi:hypothetical protein
MYRHDWQGPRIGLTQYWWRGESRRNGMVTDANTPTPRPDKAAGYRLRFVYRAISGFMLRVAGWSENRSIPFTGLRDPICGTRFPILTKIHGIRNPPQDLCLAQ